MKNTIVFVTLLALCFVCKAGEIFYPNPVQTRVVFTNQTFSSNWSSQATSLTFTNVQFTGISVFHTFQLFSVPWTNTVTIGTNNVSASLDRTIDGTNWVPFYSTNMTGAGTNAIEVVTVGKWQSYRWRLTLLGTNLTVLANYMAESE